MAINEETDPLGTLEQPLLDAGVDIVPWDAQHEPRPRSLGEFSAMIALGGASNPDEDHARPWMRGERALLRAAVERSIPTLGVCLGAQLLAQALGASAVRLPQTRIGWYALRAGAAARTDPLVPAWDTLDRVLEWHAYAFTLPRSAVLLAGAREAVQAFRAGRCAWGFQYHLEADAQIARHWSEVYAEDLVTSGVDRAELCRQSALIGRAATRHGVAVGTAFASVIAGVGARRRRPAPRAAPGAQGIPHPSTRPGGRASRRTSR